ncbi:MAG: hypothetical protein IJ109_02305 [Firmicutes bacterium]|nr:hypothetical protein [Bacillota bacterium]
MNLFLVFYIGIPALAILAGLLSRFRNQKLTTVFNILMLLAVLVGAVWTMTGHHGWIHILSFIALTIFGNLAGVTLVSRRR